jgi:hypothetical protein
LTGFAALSVLTRDRPYTLLSTDEVAVSMSNIVPPVLDAVDDVHCMNAPDVNVSAPAIF